MKLRRYRFTFDIDPDEWSQPNARLKLGLGCTAYDESDCLSMIGDKIFGEKPLPAYQVTADVDVSTLDPGHVLPNMGLVIRRGIWFPLGFE